MLFDDLFLGGGLILQDEPVILLYALVFLSIVVLYKEAYKKRQKKLRSAQPRQNLKKHEKNKGKPRKTKNN